MTDTVMDEAGVNEKIRCGRPDHRLPLLTGDSVDNIPGAPSVDQDGREVARRIRHPDTLMAHADEVKGKIGESLRASLGHAAAVAHVDHDQNRCRSNRVRRICNRMTAIVSMEAAQALPADRVAPPAGQPRRSSCAAEDPPPAAEGNT